MSRPSIKNRKEHVPDLMAALQASLARAKLKQSNTDITYRCRQCGEDYTPDKKYGCERESQERSCR